jgi:hypothetical protein
VKRDSIFRFRVTPVEADRLQTEADAQGLSKADLIRKALGWDITALPSRDMSQVLSVPVPEEPIDADKRPGASAIQQLAQRLGRKP